MGHVRLVPALKAGKPLVLECSCHGHEPGCRFRLPRRASDEGQLKDQKEKVRRLRKRLHSRETFILPEVWDVVSARIMADSGFDTIGISADALAWAHGLRRGERLDLDHHRCHNPENCPRFRGSGERGPRRHPGAALSKRSGTRSRRVISAGCVGVVIGDGGRGGAHGIVPVKDMIAVIQAVKTAALDSKIPAVITARTEAFLLDPPQHSPFETAVERAEAYFAAGADCISVPGAQHIQLIERLSGQIDGPLCVSIGLTPAPDLKALAGAGRRLRGAWLGAHALAARHAAL